MTSVTNIGFQFLSKRIIHVIDFVWNDPEKQLVIWHNLCQCWSSSHQFVGNIFITWIQNHERQTGHTDCEAESYYLPGPDDWLRKDILLSKVSNPGKYQETLLCILDIRQEEHSCSLCYLLDSIFIFHTWTVKLNIFMDN